MSSNSRPTRTRHDGWTAERQLAFLGALSLTRSITRSAAAAGMSREGAYRLRERHDGALFAARWDQILRQPYSLPTTAVRSLHENHDVEPRDERRRFTPTASSS